MFWRYIIIELKILLRQKKNLLIAIVLLAFFPLLFIQQSSEPVESLKEQKYEERQLYDGLVLYVENIEVPTEVEEKVHESVLQQSSYLNFQKYYVSNKLAWDKDQYIDYGLKLADEQLKVHELGNVGIPKQFIIPKEDILRKKEKLLYIQEHNLPLEPNTLATSHFSLTALNVISGLLISFIIIIGGSDILTYEKRHESILNGLPIHFFTKVVAKIFIRFLFIMVSLGLGLILGGAVAYYKHGLGSFNSPVSIYNNGNFEIINITQYVSISLVSLSLVTLLILILSVFLNLLFKNTFANIVMGLGLFIVPLSIVSKLADVPFLQFLTYIDYHSILTGSLAVQLNNPQLDYTYSFIWLLILCVCCSLMIFIKQKLDFYQFKGTTAKLMSNRG